MQVCCQLPVLLGAGCWVRLGNAAAAESKMGPPSSLLTLHLVTHPKGR